MRRPARRLGLLVAVTVAGCLEGTSSSRFGELRIQPEFAAGADPSTMGVQVDSTGVRVTRAGTGALVIDTALGPGADTLDHGWIVDLESSEEALRVELLLRGQGGDLYQGTASATVEAGELASGTITMVPVTYVGPPPADSVSVTPPSGTLAALGDTLHFSAQAFDAAGTPLTGRSFTWKSSNPAAATVDLATGIATAVGNGSATITATSGSASGTATVTVAQVVTSVAVSPNPAPLTTIGATRQFSAVASDAGGSPVSGTNFAWTSSDPAVATIDPATGLATATGHGSTMVSATAAGISGSTTLTVDLTAGAATVTVLPASITLTSAAATQQYQAEVRDGNGVLISGAPVTWSSSAPAVATIDAATGLATAVGHGNATITATAGAASGTATLDVNLTGAVMTVTVLPASVSLAQVGANAQLSAEVRDGNGALLTGVPVAWSSSAPQVATVDPATGLATATGHGSATITAVAGSASGTATVDVTLAPQAASVTVLPGADTLTNLSATRQFIAEVRDGNGALLPGVPVTWSSSAPSVATIDPATGLATAAGHGTATVTATTANGSSGDAALAVNLGTAATTLNVLPPTAILTALGQAQQFTAEVRDAGGNLLPGVPVSWTSSDQLVATIDPATGLAMATGHGTATITASTGNASGTARLDVNLTGTVTTVTVLPGSATLTSVGATQQFIAEARDAGGALLPGVPVTWTSSATTVATVDPATGLATATGHGTAAITATTTGGTSGTATLDVNFITQVASVTVLPASASLTTLGATQQFIAEVRDGGGSLLPGVPVAWQSSDQSVATIDPATGLATSTGHGTATITATAAGASDSATLDVNLVGVVTTVTVLPANATLAGPGDTQQFTAEVRDGTGALLSGVPVVWSSAAPLVATIDPASGLATATGLGTATISATASGVAGTALLTVTGR